jgi:hypothetical protein
MNYYQMKIIIQFFQLQVYNNNSKIIKNIIKLYFNKKCWMIYRIMQTHKKYKETNLKN